MLKLAFRSLFRHTVRTGLTLAAIIFGVAGIILSGGFIEDIFIELRESTIHSQLGHIQVYKAGYTTIGRRDPYRYLIAGSGQLVDDLAGLPQVGDVMVRLNFSGLLNNGVADLPIVGEGIEPDSEARLGSFMSIVAGRQLTDADKQGILIGKGLARTSQLEPGEFVTLLTTTPEGALNSLEFEVVGVFQTFSREYDNRAVRVHLAAARELLYTEGVHSLVIALDSTESTDAVAGMLRERLPQDGFEVKTWYELADFYSKTVDLYRRQFGVMQLIILVMVILSVANSVNMAVYERIGEFGTLMALGDRKKDVFWQVIRENILLGMLGASLGVLCGVVLALLISRIGIDMPPPPNADVGYTAYIRLVPEVIAMAFGVGVIATLLAAIFPAYRVSRLPVAEALMENV